MSEGLPALIENQNIGKSEESQCWNALQCDTDSTEIVHPHLLACGQILPWEVWPSGKGRAAEIPFGSKDEAKVWLPDKPPITNPLKA